MRCLGVYRIGSAGSSKWLLVKSEGRAFSCFWFSREMTRCALSRNWAPLVSLDGFRLSSFRRRNLIETMRERRRCQRWTTGALSQIFSFSHFILNLSLSLSALTQLFLNSLSFPLSFFFNLISYSWSYISYSFYLVLSRFLPLSLFFILSPSYPWVINYLVRCLLG